MPQGLIQAAKIAQSSAARKLPGYGKLNLGENIKAIKKVKQIAKNV